MEVDQEIPVRRCHVRSPNGETFAGFHRFHASQEKKKHTMFLKRIYASLPWKFLITTYK